MLNQNKDSMMENNEETNLKENEEGLTAENENAVVNEENISQEISEVEQTTINEEVKSEDNISTIENSDELNLAEKKSFFKSLKAVLVDEIIIALLSVILLYIGDFVLRVTGYFISEKISMLFIMFVIVSVLYPVIMESSKKGNTIGRALK